MKRIRIVVLILCACFVSVAWGQQPAGKCNNGWAQFHRYNMQRWARCEKVLGVNNVGSLQRKWSHSTGRAQVASSPAVANGVVYVGSWDGYVYALDVRSGALLWRYTAVGDEVHSSPAVANGVVYVASLDSNVYALNAKTGEKLWSFATACCGVESSPAVANGVVYIGSYNGRVWAFGLP
jgi:outer membrane protein assembly factor BamB